MLSSSKLELLDQCEGAFTLPWRDEPNVHSEAGNERHATDETRINVGDIPEEYESRWPGLTWRAEVSYMYDVSSDTSRFLGCGIKRAYGEQLPFEVPGTIDVEGRGPGILVVLDRKGFEAQSPAERHPQVRFLALAAARVEPADRVVVAIRPEIGPMDVSEIDPVFDLDVIAHEIRQRVIRAAGVRKRARAGEAISFNTGRHCRWCPAFAACPKQAELRALVQLDDEHPELALSTLVDDETAADVYELYKRIGILHKRIGQQLYAHAAVRPIPIGNGKMFGKHEKLGNERLSGDVVYQVVKAHHGQAIADAAVTREATKTKLEATLKGKRGAAKAVLAEVRELGGATRKAGETIGEYEAGPRLVTDTEEPKQIEEAAHASPF
jgi:hypothetical protein